VVYVRDLALELQRQGHTPEVFCPPEGEVARELRAAGIPVEDDLRKLPRRPDIIHGHHYTPTLVAVRHWRTVPAISICHNHGAPDDRAPFHPGIRRYFGVSRLCVERYLDDGVAEEDVSLLLNFVDMRRFAARQAPLPARPRRALVFSNYANAETHLPAVTEACERAGLALDVVGVGVGCSMADPERLLPTYDIVFAKAKAAMEGMAVGAAVVLCDYGGVGPMVTSANFDELRPLNFGLEALSEPLCADSVLQQVARYDPIDAVRVRDRIRSCASLQQAVEQLVGIYGDVMDEDARPGVDVRRPRPTLQSIRDALYLRAYWVWRSLPPSRRMVLERLGASTSVRALVRKALGMGPPSQASGPMARRSGGPRR
jgi:hypothetical protein